MSDVAGIAGNAVIAYQSALSTVSNNIANVATDGYSRQSVSMSALPVAQQGGLFFGTGVAVENIQRQYNAFIESNLRDTNSDLASQGPMVTYANRVIDVMGGQTMGLNTALDQYFTSARALSVDPSSSILRSSFVRDAEGVAQRFGQLSGQLDLIQDETKNTLDNTVSQMNTLTKQLALVNGQLTKQRTEAAQPPDLLDQRDSLLRKLSGFAHVTTSFSMNGTVTVSLGASITKDVVVEANKSIDIAAISDGTSSGKVSLMLDPYGKPSALTGVTSGTLAGLMSFRDQVLGSTRSALDGLAKTFANESNAVHQQGIDGYGNPGLALFSFNPSASSVAGGIQVALEDPMLVAAAAQFRVIEASNNTSGTNASVSFDEAPAPGTAAAPPPAGPAPLQQMLVNNSHPSAARTFNVSGSVPATPIANIANGMQDVAIYLDNMQPGQQLQILTRDGRQILGQSMANDSTTLDAVMNDYNGFALGATYSDRYLNAAKQSVQLSGTAIGAQSFLGIEIPDSTTGDTAAATAARVVAGKDSILAGDAALAAGITDISLDPNDNTRLIITSNPTTPARSPLALTTGAGISFGLGKNLSYKGMTVFYGAQAQVQMQPVYDSNDKVSGYTPFPAVLQGDRLQAISGGIAANTLTLNGIALGALDAPADGTTLQAGAVADWINTLSTQTGVTATAVNEIRLDASQLKYGMPLVINGTTIDTSAATSAAGLVNAINASSDGSFSAKTTSNGDFVLTNADGSDITLSATSSAVSNSTNALGLNSGTYRGQVSLTQPLTDADEVTITKPIQLGMAPDGTPSDLARLGFRTGAFINGAVKDDLLVFVTGAGIASVSASYAGKPVDAKQNLRNNAMQVDFLSDTEYTITDSRTGTLLAQRTLVPGVLDPGISYQGLNLSFTAPPKSGDVFSLDGNQDGIGNNDNMLAMAALETKTVVGNKTLSNAYIDHVNEMGNIARQATIAQTALTVVHDQAVSSRDALSGVSLDKEAADLIRYQQAYQSAAKVLQVASQLFDSILQVR